MKMEGKCSVNKCLLGHVQTMGHRNFNKSTFLSFCLSTYLAHVLVINGDSSITVTDPLT